MRLRLWSLLLVPLLVGAGQPIDPRTLAWDSSGGTDIVAGYEVVQGWDGAEIGSATAGLSVPLAARSGTAYAARVRALPVDSGAYQPSPWATLAAEWPDALPQIVSLSELGRTTAPLPGGGPVMAWGTPTTGTLKTDSGISSTITANQFSGAVANRLLVVQASIWNPNASVSVSGVADGTNTYTVRQATATKAGSYRQIELIAWCVVASNGNYTPVISLSNATASQTYSETVVSEFAGVDTAAPEVTYVAKNDIDIETADVSGGPITTIATTDLIVGVAGFVASSATNTWTQPSGWTVLATKNNGYDTGTAHQSSYYLPGSVQTNYSPQWAHANFQNVGSSILVAFKEASGGAASVVPVLMRHYALRRQ